MTIRIADTQEDELGTRARLEAPTGRYSTGRQGLLLSGYTYRTRDEYTQTGYYVVRSIYPCGVHRVHSVELLLYAT
jgi:hypothetical protein